MLRQRRKALMSPNSCTASFLRRNKSIPRSVRLPLFQGDPHPKLVSKTVYNTFKTEQNVGKIFVDLIEGILLDFSTLPSHFSQSRNALLLQLAVSRQIAEQSCVIDGAVEVFNPLEVRFIRPRAVQ